MQPPPTASVPAGHGSVGCRLMQAPPPTARKPSGQLKGLPGVCARVTGGRSARPITTRASVRTTTAPRIRNMFRLRTTPCHRPAATARVAYANGTAFTVTRTTDSETGTPLLLTQGDRRGENEARGDGSPCGGTHGTARSRPERYARFGARLRLRRGGRAAGARRAGRTAS